MTIALCERMHTIAQHQVAAFIKVFKRVSRKVSGLIRLTHAPRPCLFVHPAVQRASLVWLCLFPSACLALLIQLVPECGSKEH